MDGNAAGEDVRALTEALARGDQQALETLLALYLPGLHAFVRLRAGALVGPRESSSDLVQSVCREVLEHAERFRHPGEAAFRCWLYTTALRKIRSRQAFHLREKRDARREVRGEKAEAALLAQYRTFSTPSEGLAAREELERVEAAFAALTEEQREVVTLAHLVGLSRAEIAAHLGKGEGAVRMTLHRALAKLSGLLGERDPR